MIEKMKMVYVVSSVSKKDEMLDGLRDLGLLHLAEKKSPARAASPSGAPPAPARVPAGARCFPPYSPGAAVSARRHQTTREHFPTPRFQDGCMGARASPAPPPRRPAREADQQRPR